MKLPPKKSKVKKEEEVFNTIENQTCKILWKMKWASAQLDFFL